MTKKQSKTVTVAAYRLKQLENGAYVVLDGADSVISQEYAHETSAYAALGRLFANSSESNKGRKGK